MRKRVMAVLAVLLLVTACSDATGPEAMPLRDDAAFVAALSGEVGALGPYLGPALHQLRLRHRDGAANATCQEMQQLREQLRQCEQAGDGECAGQARLQLRLRAAEMIQAGLGDAPWQEMLQANERAMEQLRLRIRLHALVSGDTAGDQQQLREMLQAQEQARLRRQQGSSAEGLELAARVHERWQARNQEQVSNDTDAQFHESVRAQLGELAQYMAGAMVQMRARYGDGAGEVRAELEQIRERLRAREQDGDGEGAGQERYRLRLAAAFMIHEGLGNGPAEELLAGNEQVMEQVRARMAERAQQGKDTSDDQEMLRVMTQLQEQARLAIGEGRHEEGLELSARVREWWRAREAERAGA